jgi:hypothetical protein
VLFDGKVFTKVARIEPRPRDLVLGDELKPTAMNRMAADELTCDAVNRS